MKDVRDFAIARLTLGYCLMCANRDWLLFVLRGSKPCIFMATKSSGSIEKVFAVDDCASVMSGCMRAFLRSLLKVNRASTSETDARR